MVSLTALLWSTSAIAQNACPAQVSFNSDSVPIDASFDAVEVGDFNGDNLLDALWLDSTNAEIIVDLGDGDGGFVDSLTLTVPHLGSAAVGDLNGDNTPDVVVFDPTLGQVVIYPGAGGGALDDMVLLEAVNNNPIERAFSLYDLDGDNILDIISTQENAPSCVVARLSTEGFSAPSDCMIPNSSGRLIPFDLNGDNKDEFVQSTSAVIYKRSDLNFAVLRDLGAELNLNTIGEVKPRDVDGDGDVDLQISGTDVNGAVLVNFDN
jgi:hypothetical protein